VVLRASVRHAEARWALARANAPYETLGRSRACCLTGRLRENPSRRCAQSFALPLFCETGALRHARAGGRSSCTCRSGEAPPAAGPASSRPTPTLKRCSPRVSASPPNPRPLAAKRTILRHPARE
jgi:hypothetical protein